VYLLHCSIYFLCYLFVLCTSCTNKDNNKDNNNTADRKATTCIGKDFSTPLCKLRSTTTGTLLLDSPSTQGNSYNWVDSSRQRTESCPVSTTLVISACWRLIHYDVKISGALIRTHDLWIRKRVCYPLHHSAQRLDCWRADSYNEFVATQCRYICPMTKRVNCSLKALSFSLSLSLFFSLSLGLV